MPATFAPVACKAEIMQNCTSEMDIFCPKSRLPGSLDEVKGPQPENDVGCTMYMCFNTASSVFINLTLALLNYNDPTSFVYPYFDFFTPMKSINQKFYGDLGLVQK